MPTIPIATMAGRPAQLCQVNMEVTPLAANTTTIATLLPG
ncbi:hypothetical protein KO116_01491 [Halomonas sp. KO116]|nr:hypothetical protein KO116_01491 [Halomonas sp. KO116]